MTIDNIDRYWYAKEIAVAHGRKCLLLATDYAVGDDIGKLIETISESVTINGGIPVVAIITPLMRP